MTLRSEMPFKVALFSEFEATRTTAREEIKNQNSKERCILVETNVNSSKEEEADGMLSWSKGGDKSRNYAKGTRVPCRHHRCHV